MEKIYTITEAGTTQGLPIPTGFKIKVHSPIIVGLGNGDWEIRFSIDTYVDDTYAVKLINDDYLTSAIVVNIGDTLPLKTEVEIMGEHANDSFDVTYSGNYTED